METNYRKITYQCECACDCDGRDKQNVFVFAYSRTSDIAYLYHGTHGEPLIRLGVFSDADLNALLKLLTRFDECEKWTDEEYARLKKEMSDADKVTTKAPNETNE